MPELPEVETVLRAITPHLLHQKIEKIIVRRPTLRWPIPSQLSEFLLGKRLQNLSRRGKYLLFHFDHGTMIVHLGMSGRIVVLSKDRPPQKHDHVDIYFANHRIMRYTDPRRFGAILWTTDAHTAHPLLIKIGPEPLEDAFNGNYLFEHSRGKKVCAKSFLLNHKTVAGVGNIYATESLFLAHVHPKMEARKLSKADCAALCKAIKQVLSKAIKSGGTTLKDFTSIDGTPGYFAVALKVYGRAGETCVRCKTKLKSIRISNRSTVFCPKCQKLK